MMKVALVHDWLTGMRGGERCLEVFAELFPDADLFTLLHVPGSVSPIIERRRIVTSFIQGLPGAAHGYRRYLPFFPRAMPWPRAFPYRRLRCMSATASHRCGTSGTSTRSTSADRRAPRLVF